MASIGEASQRSGVGIETIRFYERKGVVAEPERTQGGRRQYDDTAIRKLRLIKRCRDLGFSLQEARMMLDLAEDPRQSCSDVLALAEMNLEAVREKIVDLKRLETALNTLIDRCRLGEEGCPALIELMKD